MAIEILNPIAGGVRFTTIRAARRFVVNGRAEFVSALAIRFLTKGELEARAAMKTRQAENAALQAAGREADKAVHVSIASMKQMRGLPLMRPMAMLTRRSNRQAGQ